MLVSFRLPLLLLVLYISQIQLVTAQEAVYLPYFPDDTSQLYSKALSHRRSMDKAFVVPDDVKKDYRNAYSSMVEAFSEDIYTTIRYRALLDTLIDPYVQRIFRQVVAANPALPEARLVLIRNPIENAYAMGDGTILLNVGLLSKLENESQIAFVICHEMAHIYFRHVQKGLKEHFDLFYSKEFKKQVKKIIKQEYDMYAKMNSLLQNVSLNKLYHKRAHEQQADSLGWLLLSKTAYDVSQAYRTLQLLDKIEEPYSYDKIDFVRHFGCPQTGSFLKEDPIATTSIFAVEQEEPEAFELSDTLKTHPDCKKRMQFIEHLAQKNFAVEEGGKEPALGLNKFQAIRAASRIEIIQSWYDGGRYDRACFESLLLLEKDPGNPYLTSMVMLCLYQLKDHLQRHRYADVVSRVSDYYPDNMNEFLERLHSLNLSDFEGLAACFSQHYPPVDTLGEYSLAAAYAYHCLTGKEAAADEIKLEYQQKYRQSTLGISLSF